MARVFFEPCTKPLALTILRTENDPALQKQAIQSLGIMEATEELGELYANMTSRESRVAILEAMAIAEDTDGLKTNLFLLFDLMELF